MALTLSWVSVGSGLPATSLRVWKILLFCSRKNLDTSYKRCDSLRFCSLALNCKTKIYLISIWLITALIKFYISELPLCWSHKKIELCLFSAYSDWSEVTTPLDLNWIIYLQDKEILFTGHTVSILLLGVQQHLPTHRHTHRHTLYV